MNYVIGFAKSVSPPGWMRQRYREPLSLVLRERVFSDRSKQIAAFRPGEIQTSARANRDPITGCRPAPSTLGRCHPFNAHRPGFVRRFSPIRL
jgi:hypothetical protein